jgi:predicted phage terminase large subunit-like protein
VQTAENLELAALRALQTGIEPLEAFIARVVPKHARVPRHLRRIVEVFEASRHREMRVTIAMPPRHGKTVTIGAGLAWRTLYDPACLNFYAGFADDLAKHTSRNIRRMVRAAGVPLSAEAQGVNDWRTIHEGGLKATSVGGGITGRGCNGGVIVLDDTIKGREVANSKLQRDKIFDWAKADVLSRIEPGASVIVMNTRWHEDDIIGRLMADGMGEDWTHISIPAVGDELGNPVDERIDPEAARALWPEGGYDLRRLSTIRARGEYDWWSLYQQCPRPPSGRMFAGEPGRFDLSTFRWDVNGRRGLIVCDPAGTAKTSSDYSVAMVLAIEGVGDETRMYVLDVLRGQWEIPVLVSKLLDFQGRHRGLPIAVEAVGGFVAVPQMLRAAAPALRVLPLGEVGTPGYRLVRADKFTRAQPVSHAWRGTTEAGKETPRRVLVPIDAPWVHALITECQAFTGLGDAHDDQVDCLSHGWNRLYQERPAGSRNTSYADGAA